MTRVDYAEVRAAMSASPERSAEIKDDCRRRIVRKPAAEITKAAKVMEVPEAEVPVTYCGRIFDALRTGKLSYEEFIAVQKSHRKHLTPCCVRPSRPSDHSSPNLRNPSMRVYYDIDADLNLIIDGSTGAAGPFCSVRSIQPEKGEMTHGF